MNRVDCSCDGGIAGEGDRAHICRECGGNGWYLLVDFTAAANRPDGQS